MSIQALNWAFGQSLPMSEKFTLVVNAAQWSPTEFADPAPARYRRPVQGHLYMIGWPHLGVLKVGITRAGSTRWRAFVRRGGVVLSLRAHADPSAPERALLDMLAADYPSAFESKEVAREHLGAGGGGFSECFLVPEADWPGIVQAAERWST